jgi:hypothetical protein
MPEILTESFCERCGTRYTFESVAPRKTRKLGQFKTLSKGVKNWVMSDDSSLDEAMAAARGDEERAATAQQLDAFHSTFNFCMNCRQYTCGNCWNAAEGRCLTCAPNLGAEILQAPFPDAPAFEPVRLDVGAWPEADLSTNGDAAAATNGTAPDLDVLLGGNGVHHEEPGGAPAGSDEIPEVDAAFRLSFLSGEATAPAWPADAPGPEADAFDGAADLIGLPEPELPQPEPGVAAEAADAAPSHDHDLGETLAAALALDAVVDAAAADARPAAPAHDVAAAATSHPETAPLPEDLEGRAAAMNARTAELLARFRPGESIDAELDAYEAELDATDDSTGVPAADVAGKAAVVAGVEALADDTPVAGAAEVAPEEDRSIAAAAALAAAAAAAGRLDGSDAHEHEDHGHEPRVAARSAAAASAQATASNEPEPAPEPVVAPEAEPEPAIAAEAAPEPAIAAASAAEPAPETEPAPAAAEPAREDRIEQPTWRIFAPDPQNPAAPTTLPPAPPAQPSIPVQASADPQWPSRPDVDESPSMALLANRARSSSEAMWAASAREVANAPVGVVPAPVAGVQPCSSCGLSLSANARFCRRCGTRQG